MTSFTPPARPTGVLDVCLFLLTYAVQDGAVWHCGRVCDLTVMTPQEYTCWPVYTVPSGHAVTTRGLIKIDRGLALRSVS